MADNCLETDVNGGKIVRKRRVKQPEVRREDRLMQLAVNLRDVLHGFVELFDEHDPAGNKAIREFDEFVGGVELVNRSVKYCGD